MSNDPKAFDFNSDIIERVGRTFAAVEQADYMEDWERYDEYARAAIVAMREPTERQINAARDWSVRKNGQGLGNDQATGCWQAMIDGALP